MEATYKHYILTRYNLELYTSNPYKVVNRDDWMTKRVKLFKRYLDSLSKQTNKDFTIILAFDSNTPDLYHTELIFLLDSTDLNYIVSYDKQPNVWLKENKPNTEWLITTRLDNDDEVKESFVDVIHKSFKAKEELIDVRGVKMFKGKEYPYNRKDIGSPFITLIEPTEKCKSAMFKTHSIMPKYYSSRFASSEPLFIQNIHDNNQSNSLTQG